MHEQKFSFDFQTQRFLCIFSPEIEWHSLFGPEILSTLRKMPFFVTSWPKFMKIVMKTLDVKVVFIKVFLSGKLNGTFFLGLRPRFRRKNSLFLFLKAENPK